MELKSFTCPNCGSVRTNTFHEVKRVPVHSVLLMPTREEAINFERRDILLAHCDDCDFVWNAIFDPNVHSYSGKYEETQGFSPTFNVFHERLADQLIKRYDLHNKDIMEIGCGKGEFLTLLCEKGLNRGVGIDPAYVEERNVSPAKERMTFIKDFYSEKYNHLKADFICCKMTLEHIPNIAEFISTLRKGIGKQKDTVVFFQVPDATRVFKECAFWDIYYEHCSYFGPKSLTYVFEHNGFEVTDVWTDYDDQYLMIEAKPSEKEKDSSYSTQNTLESVSDYLQSFTESYNINMIRWENYLKTLNDEGHKVVIWGSGSKGVAFLTSLKNQEHIQYGVDINPYKFGTFLAGTGQEIVGPEFLKIYQPDIVIVMNPVYMKEIENDLLKLNLSPELVPV